MKGVYIVKGHDDELCGGISVGTSQFSSGRDPNYGILLGIQITVFYWVFILRYSVRDSNSGIRLGIQITVFC